ncbi:MAG: class D beta-lactamase [Bacteroidales bacterium]|nr:class D beta-lactamase [Bacteroidales bacterium]MDD4603359.1 class D beta-lactamase [Bacteroidales bacterium]
MKKVLILLALFATFLPGFINAQNKIKTGDVPELKTIFDKYGMKGTLLILDGQNNELYGYQSALWDSGYLPASTFKIANTLIGLETGVIDTNTIFKWDGKPRRISSWDQDLSLQQAFRLSCVPCYQEVARKINAARMKEYLNRLNYGKMDVHPGNIDLFWLEGNSRITPREQVDFIQRLFNGKLPLSISVMNSVKQILINEQTMEYTLSGKTGWAIRNGNNYGWFVGYLQTKNGVYFVATLVEPIDQEKIPDFILARKTITMDVFRFFSLIK